jgi:hypothetical protein
VTSRWVDEVAQRFAALPLTSGRRTLENLERRKLPLQESE